MKKDKIDQDFQSFNLDIERTTEREIMNIREEIRALKEKAAEIGERFEPLSPMKGKGVS